MTGRGAVRRRAHGRALLWLVLANVALMLADATGYLSAAGPAGALGWAFVAVAMVAQIATANLLVVLPLLVVSQLGRGYVLAGLLAPLVLTCLRLHRPEDLRALPLPPERPGREHAHHAGRLGLDARAAGRAGALDRPRAGAPRGGVRRLRRARASFPVGGAGAQQPPGLARPRGGRRRARRGRARHLRAQRHRRRRGRDAERAARAPLPALHRAALAPPLHAHPARRSAGGRARERDARAPLPAGAAPLRRARAAPEHRLDRARQLARRHLHAREHTRDVAPRAALPGLPPPRERRQLDT